MYYDLITSDIHIGHVNIISYSHRTHRSVEQMNEDIVARWNAQVDPSDHVLVVEDLVMGRVDDSLAFVSRLHGHIHLRTGNHDRPAPMHGRRALGWEQRYLDAGVETIVHGTGRFSLDPAHRHLLISHFPYSGDSEPQDRFAEQRPLDTGEWLVHGHVHDLWRQNGRMLNVGLDAWGGYLVTPAQVAALIDAGPRQLDRIAWDQPFVPAY
jgi:calcineurin-like phosphoesterase family protein